MEVNILIKTLRKSLIAVFFVAFLLATALCTVNYYSDSNVSAYALTMETELQDEYDINESITIPTAKFGSLDADMRVVFPSGYAKADYNVKLIEAGKYSVIYSAKGENEYFEDVVTFDVINTLYTINGEKTTAEYTTVNGKSGLKVSFAEKETMIFNQVIDLNGATKGDVFLEFFSAPVDPSVREHSKVHVRLIDSKDPDNYVDILNQGSLDPYAYTLVGAHGQDMVGHEAYGISNDKFHVNNEWGAYSYYSYYNTIGAPGTYTLTFKYDEVEKQFYVGDKMIADLNSPDDYYTLWNGFTSNRVYVQIWLDGFDTATANLMILRVGDIDLTATGFVDVVAPSISVDVDEANVPLAKVGHEYKIFDAVADDFVDLKSQINVRVYYESSGKKVDVSIDNGYFKPTKETTYYVEYSSTDSSGNRAEKTIAVFATEGGVKNPVITIIGTKTMSAFVGEEVNVADYVVSGGSGDLAVDVNVYCGQDTVELFENEFVPLKEGVYTVSYKVTDYLGLSTTTYYNVNVAYSADPIFVEEPTLPKYFISGSHYIFDEYYAVDYSNGGAKVLATVRVEDKNGLNPLDYSTEYVPAIENHLDVVKVYFKAGNTEKVVEIPCIQGAVYNDNIGMNEISVENYFVGDAAITPHDDAMFISAVDANSKWIFANKQIANGFVMNVGGVTDSSAFDGIKFRFEDSLNSKYAIELTLTNDGMNGPATAIMGSHSLKTEFTWKDDAVLAVSLLDGYMTLGSAKLLYSTYVDGTTFNGFPSNFIYVSCEFVNANVDAQYKVISVNEQLVSSYKTDMMAPKILLLNKTTGGSYLPGDTIDITAVVVGDVLSGNVKATLDVYDSDYNYITALDGTLLRDADPSKGYQIVLKDIGVYYVRYSAYDENEKVSEYPISIMILDVIAPTMEINGADTAGKVGDSIAIASVKVSDNYDAVEDIEVYCVVTAPNGNKAVITIDGTKDQRFVAANSGTYTLTYFAIDKAGNMATASYSVVVK